jgi:hypothetical protein
MKSMLELIPFPFYRKLSVQCKSVVTTIIIYNVDKLILFHVYNPRSELIFQSKREQVAFNEMIMITEW